MNVAGNPQAPLHGLAAEFDSAAELYAAAEKIRDAGYRAFDVYSPFPIHGMDQAMGLKPSNLGKFIFIGGLTGFLTAVGLQFIPSSILYPLVVAGKPTGFFTVPAFFPIMFELTVLFASFTAFFGLLIANGLPRWNHPVFNWDRFTRVSDDKFFAMIESRDPKFQAQDAGAFLAELGGSNITLVHED